MVVKIELLGNPQTKLRPRFSRWKGRVRTYDQQSEEKNTARWLMKAKMPFEPFECPLHVEMDFHFTRPKSVKRLFHTVKPDVDNLVKFVLDNGNGVVWIDDKQIVKITARKCYDKEAKTVIRVREADDWHSGD